MQVWIPVVRRRILAPAILIRHLDAERSVVQLSDGGNMTVPRDSVFLSSSEAVQSLETRVRHELSRDPFRQ